MDFQDIKPEQLVIFGEAIANSLALELPYSMQYVTGNWLLLLGQVIITYNAQQQLQQDGYGKRYSPKNRDINNPACKKKQNQVVDQNIAALEKTVISLQQQIDCIKQQMSFENFEEK